MRYEDRKGCVKKLLTKLMLEGKVFNYDYICKFDIDHLTRCGRCNGYNRKCEYYEQITIEKAGELLFSPDKRHEGNDEQSAYI
jgi:hypothetical protein